MVNRCSPVWASTFFMSRCSIIRHLSLRTSVAMLSVCSETEVIYFAFLGPLEIEGGVSSDCPVGRKSALAA